MFKIFSFMRSGWRDLCAAILLGWLAAAAQAQGGADLQNQVRQWLQTAVVAPIGADGLPLRMDVQVGAPDARLRLAPCGNTEVYLPPGARLWGNTRVGVRCVDGMSRWNITLPVQVQAWGKAWVLRDQVAAGTILAADHASLAEVQWTQEASPVLPQRADWLGQVAARSLPAGQALRSGMTRPAQVFQAGASVRVVAQGAGFQVSTAAQALSPGVVGQSARVRMDNGRITSGVVIDPLTVRLDL